MAISDRTRKILWARAGNRCAICRQPLVLALNETPAAVLIGEECHIVARSLNGPRGSDLLADPDNYQNLILLCPNDHARVDSEPSLFTSNALVKKRAEHEAWVSATLSYERPKQLRVLRAPDEALSTLSLVTTGGELFSLTGQCMAAEYGNDELLTSEEVDLVGGFFQDLKDWTDILNDIEISDRLKAEFGLAESITTLAESGFVVYACRLNRTLQEGEEHSPWPVAIVHVLRIAGHPELFKKPGVGHSPS